MEDAYQTQLVVDNRLCSIEVIDTVGAGKVAFVLTSISLSLYRGVWRISMAPVSRS